MNSKLTSIKFTRETQDIKQSAKKPKHDNKLNNILPSYSQENEPKKESGSHLQ